MSEPSPQPQTISSHSFKEQNSTTPSPQTLSNSVYGKSHPETIARSYKKTKSNSFSATSAKVDIEPSHTSTQFISALPFEEQLGIYHLKTIVAPPATTPLPPSISLANDLAAGLLVAQQQGQINYRTSNYHKVQTAIYVLRKERTMTLEQAAQRARIQPSILFQVAKWGQERPGRFDPFQISMANSR